MFLLSSMVVGCGQLELSPGADFQVRWLDEQALLVEERAAEVEVEVRVEGCRSFELSIEVPGSSGSQTTRVEFETGEDGITVARVPLPAFFPETSWGCVTVQHGRQFQMAARCLDDGRKRQSALRSYTYSTAKEMLRLSGLGRSTALAGEEPWLFLAGEHLQILEETASGLRSLDRFPLPSARAHLLAQRGSTLWVWSEGSLSRFQWNPAFKRWTAISAVELQGSWSRMEVGSDDSLWLLSPHGGTLLSVRGEQQTLVRFEDDVSPEGFSRAPDGSLRFLSASKETGMVRLRAEGAAAAVQREQAVPGSGHIEKISSSPDGSQWVALRAGRLYAGDWERVVELQTDLPVGASGHLVHLAWTPASLLVGHGEVLAAFSRTASFSAGFRVVLDKGTYVEGLRIGTDRIAMTTSKGVRLLGFDGQIRGGADPLPCALSPNSIAVPLGSGRTPFLVEDDLLVLGSEAR